jgi:hypothetical protein
VPPWPANEPEVTNTAPSLRPVTPVLCRPRSCDTTMRGNQVRLEMPPQAARAKARQERGRVVESIARSARPGVAAPFPRGGISCTLPRSRLPLQIIADYRRLSAALIASRAGRGRPSGPQYLGVRTDRLSHRSPAAELTPYPEVEWGPDLSSPSGVVSTCSTDQPLRHRRSSTSTLMPVCCDHPTRVSVSPFQVSSSWRWCRRVGSDRSSLGDRECGKSMDVYIRRRSGSSRSDRSVSRSSARRNSSFESGRWSGGGLRRGRRSSVTSEPPPPRRQVAVGRPTRGR